MKLKIGLLHHIVNNTDRLKTLIEQEWNRNNTWIKKCREYMNKTGMNISMLEGIKYIEIKKEWTFQRMKNGWWKVKVP